MRTQSAHFFISILLILNLISPALASDFKLDATCSGALGAHANIQNQIGEGKLAPNTANIGKLLFERALKGLKQDVVNKQVETTFISQSKLFEQKRYSEYNALLYKCIDYADSSKSTLKP